MAKPDDFDFYCAEALSGKTKIKKLYESDKVLAYYHTQPHWEKHIVIIPKEHIHDLEALSDEHDALIVEIIKVARDLSKKLDKKKGVKLQTNLGKFQDTPHLHFHLAQGNPIK